MGITAVYSSSVFKNETHIFETISIDMRGGQRSSLSAIILTRKAEIQCFQYDDEDKYILEYDDWQYIDTIKHDSISRQRITHSCNRVTAKLVNEYGVDDVGRMNHLCVTTRSETKTPFCDECKFNDVTNREYFSNLQITLVESLGKRRAIEVLNFFQERFEELPATTLRVEPRSQMPKVPDEARQREYGVAWGAWA